MSADDEPLGGPRLANGTGRVVGFGSLAVSTSKNNRAASGLPNQLVLIVPDSRCKVLNVLHTVVSDLAKRTFTTETRDGPVDRSTCAPGDCLIVQDSCDTVDWLRP